MTFYKTKLFTAVIIYEIIPLWACCPIPQIDAPSPYQGAERFCERFSTE